MKVERTETRWLKSLWSDYSKELSTGLYDAWIPAVDCKGHVRSVKHIPAIARRRIRRMQSLNALPRTVLTLLSRSLHPIPSHPPPYRSTSSCSSVLPTLCNFVPTTPSSTPPPPFPSPSASIRLHLATKSLICASPLSSPSPASASSSWKRYSLFSPLGPRLFSIWRARASGSCGPRN